MLKKFRFDSNINFQFRKHYTTNSMFVSTAFINYYLSLINKFFFFLHHQIF